MFTIFVAVADSVGSSDPSSWPTSAGRSRQVERGPEKRQREKSVAVQLAAVVVQADTRRGGAALASAAVDAIGVGRHHLVAADHAVAAAVVEEPHVEPRQLA